MPIMKWQESDVIVMTRMMKHETAWRLAQCHEYRLGNTSLIALAMINN